MTDDELNHLIRQSSSPPAFPASFQREVWQRIAVSESRSFTAVLGRISSKYLHWIVRPAGAVATVMTMLIVGAGLGGLASARSTETSLKDAYAASINPIISAHFASDK